MPFLAPLYLIGAAAAGIPIVLHMISRRRAQRLPFPTIRFLKSSNEQTSRRQKIQDLFLLLLRVLLFILLAVALAQPFLGTRAFGLGRGIQAVIVLDNSFSMGTEHEGSPRFARAKDLAIVCVDSLPEGSEAALLLASPPSGQPRPLLTSDRAAVRGAVHKAHLSQARADLTAAVQRAYDLLEQEEEKAPTREVYLVTDLQANAWTPPSETEQAKPETEGPKPNLVIVDAGRDDYRNLAVTELIVRGGARVRGRPVSLQAKVHNYAPKAATVNATLYVDGAKQANQQLEIPGSLTATATFSHTFDAAGVHTGWVQIGDDSLALDNRRDFSIDIQEHIPAAIIRESHTGMPTLDPAFFVAKALDPFGSDPSKTAALVQTTLTDYEQVTHEFLKKHKVVVLVDPGSLKRSQAAVLRRYVRRGGRLIIFPGPSLRAKTMNVFLNGEGDLPGGDSALMPVTVHEPAQGLVSRREFKTLVNLDTDHPALRIFKNYRRLVQTVKVYNYAPIDVEQTSPARILIGLSDGKPFLLENAFEKGRVLLFASAADPDWSNLGAGRFLVPLLHRLVYYLTEQSDVEGTHIVGAPVQLTLRELSRPVTIRVRDPDGEVIELPAAPVKGITQASFQQTDQRGPYVYLVLDPNAPAEGDPDAARLQAERGFVVNLDPRESDLTRMPQGELSRLLEGRQVFFAATADELRGTIERMREGVPLRNLILFVVLFIAIFETFFANRIVPALQRAEEERPVPVGAPAAASAES